MNHAITIEQGKSLRYEKVVSFRKKMVVSEINDQITRFVQKLKESGAQKSGPMISTTHVVEVIDNEQVLDIEFLVPIDREIEFETPYKYKREFQLVNALYVRYIGNPMEIHGTINNLMTYISSRGMQNITSLYNVNISENEQDKNETIVDLYISINPNIV